MSAEPTLPMETMARLLGLDIFALKELRKQKVITAPARKTEWPVGVVTQYVEYLRVRAFGGGEDDAHVQRTRLLKQQADKLEMENSATRDETVGVVAASLVWAEIIGQSKSRLMAIPAKLAPIVAVEDAPAICKALIEEQVYEVLDELADDIAVWAEDAGSGLDEGGSDGIETAAEIDDQRVGRQPPETVA